MEFEIKDKENYVVILLKGELMAQYQSSELLKQVTSSIHSGQKNFIFNLEKLKYINSSGLSMLLNVLNKSRKIGGDTVLINISDHLNKLLIITKLHSTFMVATNIEEAIVHFKSSMSTDISS